MLFELEGQYSTTTMHPGEALLDLVSVLPLLRPMIAAVRPPSDWLT